MSSPVELIAFLRARLDEDEAIARAVEPLGHVFDMGGTRLNEAFSHTRIKFASEDGRSYQQPDPAAERHFARHDPDRVLREVETGRAILTRYDDCLARQEDSDYRAGAARDQVREYEDFVLPNLAAEFSDHPDYQQEWKP